MRYGATLGANGATSSGKVITSVIFSESVILEKVFGNAKHKDNAD
jgi:hypothetical protein